MSDAPLYYLDLYSSNDVDNPTSGTIEGNKRFNILSFYPNPEPVGKFRRKGDGSGKMPAQRRTIYKIEFEPFSWHKNADSQYNDMDDLTDLQFTLTQPYLLIYDCNFPWSENKIPESQPYPKTNSQYPRNIRVSWNGNISDSIDKSNGRIEVDIELEDYYPDYLSKPVGPFDDETAPDDWEWTAASGEE